MKLYAISRIGDNNKCEFFDKTNSLMFYTNTEVKEGISVTCVFNAKNEILANIKHKDIKVRTKNFYVEEKSGNNFSINLDEKSNLKNEEMDINLKRSFFNKKLQLFVNNNLIMKAYCTTLFRQYLQGKYMINILDESKLNLSVYMALIAFMAIADEYNCTQANSF